MSTMTDEEVNRIADALALRVEQSNREFWIEPEKHYLAHNDLNQMVADYQSAKGIFWRVFVTFIAGGAIIAAGWAALGGRIK